MSQSEVLDWLKKHPGWHRWKEISDGSGSRKVSDALRRLRRWKQVERRTNEMRQIEYRYKEG